jgi:hypothetical protein
MQKTAFLTQYNMNNRQKQLIQQSNKSERADFNAKPLGLMVGVYHRVNLGTIVGLYPGVKPLGLIQQLRKSSEDQFILVILLM